MANELTKKFKNSTIVIQDNNSRYNILLHCCIGKKNVFKPFQRKTRMKFQNNTIYETVTLSSSLTVRIINDRIIFIVIGNDP